MEVQVVSFWETENGSGWRIRETGKRVSCKLKRNGMHGGQVGSFGKRETASGKQVSWKLQETGCIEVQVGGFGETGQWDGYQLCHL